MNNINDISEFINQKSILQEDLVRRSLIQKNIVQDLQQFLDEIEQAAEAIRNIAKKTKEQVQYKISEAGSLMLESVFDPAPEIHVEFEIKRNQTECIICFKKKDELYLPMDEDGFGCGDVAGFGLRIAIWSLPTHKSRPIIIMDEPFKHLKGVEANIAAIQAVKKISEKLGMQIIMISDERVSYEEVEKGADRIFKVSMENDESKLEVF